jgi:hypothetical protein
MPIYFSKKIFGIRYGSYINKKINIVNEIKFKKLNLDYLNFILSNLSDNNFIEIYMCYSNDKDIFIDNKYKYIWIRVNKDFLINIKYNISINI